MSKAIITEQHLHDIADAIIAKGGATAPMTPAQMPAAIASIPSGGGGWGQPFSDWPNLYKLLEDNADANYPDALIYLYDKSTREVELNGGVKYLTSDGDVINASTGTAYFTDDSWHWIIAYYNKYKRLATYNCYSTDGLTILTKCIALVSTESFNADEETSGSLVTVIDGTARAILRLFDVGYSVNNNVNHGNGFTNQSAIVRINPTRKIKNENHSGGSWSGYFSACYSLEVVPEIDFGKVTNASRMFIDCASMRMLDAEIDLSECTDATGMFQRCYSLTKVQDRFDLSLCRSTSAMFASCSALLSLPTHVTAIRGLSFANSRFVSKESVATFDANGDVVGGFVGNLNTKPSDAGTQTMAFHANTKALFTTDEWTAVKTCLTDKGWAVTPA